MINSFEDYVDDGYIQSVTQYQPLSDIQIYTSDKKVARIDSYFIVERVNNEEHEIMFNGSNLTIPASENYSTRILVRCRSNLSDMVEQHFKTFQEHENYRDKMLRLLINISGASRYVVETPSGEETVYIKHDDSDIPF